MVLYIKSVVYQTFLPFPSPLRKAPEVITKGHCLIAEDIITRVLYLGQVTCKHKCLCYNQLRK